MVRIQLHPRNPLDKVNSQPSIFHRDLRFMWGMQSRLMGGKEKSPLENVTQSGLLEGNPGLTLHQNMAPKGDELYASLPLVHKKRVTGCNHLYASKPRTAHASSSREKMAGYEDEKMSPNQSETYDDPRRENFMVHEEDTQSNSEFTNPQMPIA
ncbi:hypothetical protein O181_032820 [Austropuccinia psidii MF-1]|uniref:Uncharacterized protein n=1 Tax=Austropuccinia psidii MF-1 TaxID=1389203 RepID=A0A9Q3H8K7_9BASI|nr:hypothetical protein [Austropuccinia psidii MF-1]